MTCATALTKALFLIAFLAFPPRHTGTTVDASAGFTRLQALKGTWESTMKGGSKSRLHYKPISGNSAVLERFDNDKLGAGNTMVTVYYIDGDQLLLQHYSMAKNQPRMQAVSYDPAKNELRFVFLDATGLRSPQDGRMHNATFQFIDSNHIREDWEFFENGKQQFTESQQYKRVNQE